MSEAFDLEAGAGDWRLGGPANPSIGIRGDARHRIGDLG
jgi:hypothetical protein